jgi:hypothetical protein
MSWLDDLLRATEDLEAPPKWFWWSGLAAISAAVRRNVWIDREGHFKTYPNIFVALISPESGARKGPPINACKNTLREADVTRVISGRNSIQGVMRLLAQPKKFKDGSEIKDAQGILISGEFSTFLTQDPDALSILVDLYNSSEHEEWEYNLKEPPPITLKAPCVTMLIASNESLFDDKVKRKEIEGGFVGRIIMVKEGRSSKINALVDDSPENPLPYHKKLATRLIEASNLRGRFKWSEAARRRYKEWYGDLCRAGIKDRTGTYRRLGDQVLKVVQLVNIAKGDDMYLEIRDVELAIDRCGECAESGARIMSSTEPHNGDRPNISKLIIEHLERTGGDTKSNMILLFNRYSIQTAQFNHYIKDLVQGEIVYQRIANGTERLDKRTVFGLTDDYLDSIRNAYSFKKRAAPKD